MSTNSLGRLNDALFDELERLAALERVSAGRYGTEERK